MLERPPSLDKRQKRAVAQRKYRKRYSDGRFVVLVEVGDDAEVEMLVALQWLAADKRDDKREIGAAIAAMLKDTAKNRA